ncbi:uncharacterized protein LOC122375871 [Amphibalanus amphitrite]|uniref:uncharacterized protein LOC122375871 n=1 Tax=Amphibalanus amphitrite TaxID=1232801 RepID=UPI001C923062|nr:uncharacterized protein LOC122375871 [Amphibalanus amphitrite]
MTALLWLLLLLGSSLLCAAAGQDYEVAEIRCSFSGDGGAPDRLSARLRKPPGFRGDPLFADDRQVIPQLDSACQIRADPSDPDRLIYSLLVTDFSRCGVLKRDGFVNVRLWFPQLPGVVMMSDQEVIIMCKPTQATVVEERVAAFAGRVPSGGRVSGVVEESPGRLEYEVGLFRENSLNSGKFSVPVDEPVPIGTRLQLLTRISTDAAWKYAELLEVTVSGSQTDPYAPGFVQLVQDSCRNPELTSIVLTQPYQTAERPHEVRLTLEAFLLGQADGQQDATQLWLHTKVLACARKDDCKPAFCLDLFQPSGHGRRRRRSARAPVTEAPTTARSLSSNLTSFGDNIGIKVVMPEDFYVAASRMQSSCSSFAVLISLMGCFLAISCGLLCFLAVRLQRSLAAQKRESLDDVIFRHMRQLERERERVRKLHHENLSNPEYATDTSTISAGSVAEF